MLRVLRSCRFSHRCAGRPARSRWCKSTAMKVELCPGSVEWGRNSGIESAKLRWMTKAPRRGRNRAALSLERLAATVSQSRSNGEAHAFFRGLTATAAGSVGVSSFLLRPPPTGRSKERWRRSAAGLARLSLAVAPPVTAVSRARLRFSAAIRSNTGVGATTSRGLIGMPFSLASISSRNAS
jgi:hypothetical protein